MDNYIMFEGKKIPLTEEQVQMLKQGDKKESPFERKKSNRFYLIPPCGRVTEVFDAGCYDDDLCFENANYCRDEELMEKRAFYEKVERNLWRFSMENGGSGNYIVSYDGSYKVWQCTHSHNLYFGPSFKSLGIAERAIREVLLPMLGEEKKEVEDLFEWEV